MSSSIAHKFTRVVLGFTLLLILAGGLVTSTGSGLAVPDWPTSYGTFFPPMVGGILYEHSHRVIASFVGLLTLIQVFVYMSCEKRIWVRYFSLLCLLLVVVQGILGGMTVKYLLPAWISIFHACLAQTFFMLTGALALFTSNEWTQRIPLTSDVSRSVRRLCLVTFIFVYMQLILGAIARHTEGRHIEYHFGFAFLIAMHTLFIILKTTRDPKIQSVLFKHAMLLGFFVVAQLFAGFGAYLFALVLPEPLVPGFPDVFWRTIHQTNGALVLLTAFLLMLRAYRSLKVER